MIKESRESTLAGDYLAALRTYSEQGPEMDLNAARELGEQAVAIGLETMDLAKIHEQSLAMLQLPDSSSATREHLSTCAADFFTEAITPIEMTHCAAREAKADLDQLTATLDERTLDLADSNRELQKQFTGRAKAEVALRDSEAASGQLLRDSQDLEQKLRQMTHRILAATEAGRTRMNLQINNEIAQTLLGINIRLLALKHEVASDHAMLIQETATARQESAKLLNQSRRMQQETRNLSRQLLSGQDANPRKLNGELQDVIARTLTGINGRLAALESESAASTRQFHRQITRAQRLVAKSVDIVHRFAGELRPTVLDDLGLIPALKSFMKGFIEDTGIRASLTVFAGVEESNNTVRTMLYRVAQEALTNVARHSRASQVDVSLQQPNGTILMEIKDNGKGFEVEGNSSMLKHNRLGLLGMRERAEMVGGTFCVESAPGQATTVRVEIPPEKKRTTKVPSEKPTKHSLK